MTEITEIRKSEVEGLLKNRMAEIAPYAFGNTAGPFKDEYVRFAKALREVLEQKSRERRVRVLDYPKDDGRLWNELGVESNTDGVVIAYQSA